MVGIAVVVDGDIKRSVIVGLGGQDFDLDEGVDGNVGLGDVKVEDIQGFGVDGKEIALGVEAQLSVGKLHQLGIEDPRARLLGTDDGVVVHKGEKATRRGRSTSTIRRTIEGQVVVGCATRNVKRHQELSELESSRGRQVKAVDKQRLGVDWGSEAGGGDGGGDISDGEVITVGAKAIVEILSVGGIG